MKSEKFIISIKNSGNTEDYTSIVKLINSSYEKAESWTDKNLEVVSKERDRTNEEELKMILNDKSKRFLLLTDSNKNYIASIVLELEHDFHLTNEIPPVNHFSFSLFAVSPEFQSQGIGKHLLKFGEAYMKFVVESAKGLNTKDERVSISEKLKKEYNYDFDMETEINTYDKKFLIEINDIYINCIIDKKELFAMYKKANYKDLGVRTPLSEFIEAKNIKFPSYFAFLIKSISSIPY